MQSDERQSGVLATRDDRGRAESLGVREPLPAGLNVTGVILLSLLAFGCRPSVDVSTGKEKTDGRAFTFVADEQPGDSSMGSVTRVRVEVEGQAGGREQRRGLTEVLDKANRKPVLK